MSIRERCIKIHIDHLKKSFSLICGLRTLKIYLPLKEYNILQAEVKGMNWWNITDEFIECRKNIDIPYELKYENEQGFINQGFIVDVGESADVIYTNY